MPKYNKVHIEISNICNLQCSFCPEVIRSKKLMDLSLFSSIIEQVAPLTEQVALHLMGDPLVHPNFAEFVNICDQYQVKIFLVTNGMLLKDSHRELLLHPAFRQVNFSMHSFFDNFPLKDPSQYLERIFKYTDCALADRPDLYINFRLWNLQDPRGSIAKNQDMLQRVADHYKITIPSDLDVQKKKSYRIKGRLYLHFDTEFTWPAIDLPILGEVGKCYGLSSHFGVLADGIVVPCCLDKEGNIPLGNANDQPIVDILNSARAQSILSGFHKRKLVEDLCRRCQYIDRFGRTSSTKKLLEIESIPNTIRT